MSEELKAELRELLEIKFPWLMDAHEPADGGDTVEAVTEMYVEAGGEVAA